MSINGLNPLSYLGVNSPNPAAQVFASNANPTVNDSLNVTIGDIWINQNTNTLPVHTEAVFVLTSLAGGVANWTEIGMSGNVLTVVGSLNIAVVTAAGVATVSLTDDVDITGSLSAVTIFAQNALFSNGETNTTGAEVSFHKSFGIGAVQPGDTIGLLNFEGYDGVTYQDSADIRVDVTGTVGVGRVPTVMRFFTSPDAVSAPVEQMTILETGTVNLTRGLATPELAVINNQNNGTFGEMAFVKSRAANAVQSGDVLGRIVFAGDDGTTIQESAQILIDTTGTIGAGQVPSQIKFYTTPDSVSAMQERVVIDQDGAVIINPIGGGVSLFVSDSASVTSAFDAGSISSDFIAVTGDGVGFLGSTSFTNATVANVPGGGTLTIDSQSANPGAQAGFMKIYVGGVPAYIPYYTSIAP